MEFNLKNVKWNALLFEGGGQSTFSKLSSF